MSCIEFERNWLGNRKSYERNLIFNGTRVEIAEPKSSYLDNANEVTNFFGCLETFLACTVFLPSFIVDRHQMAELTWGKGAPPHPL